MKNYWLKDDEEFQKEIQEAIARAWCHKKNEKKILDPNLISIISERIIEAEFPEMTPENTVFIDCKLWHVLCVLNKKEDFDLFDAIHKEVYDVLYKKMIEKYSLNEEEFSISRSFHSSYWNEFGNVLKRTLKATFLRYRIFMIEYFLCEIGRNKERIRVGNSY